MDVLLIHYHLWEGRDHVLSDTGLKKIIETLEMIIYLLEIFNLCNTVNTESWAHRKRKQKLKVSCEIIKEKYVETGLNSRVVFVMTLTTHLPGVKKKTSL